MKSMSLVIPHPIPYQGSKRRIAARILTYFPEGLETLIEPFAGSAAVSLAAACGRKAERFHLSDSNTALMALWREIIERPESIARVYEALWNAQSGNEKRYYQEVRAAFNREARAEYLLYLLARCVKAAVRYNAEGAFNQSPDHRRKGTRPVTMKAHIQRAAELFRNRSTVRAGDYRGAIQEATPRDLIYMDPPYQGVCGSRDPRYLNEVTFSDFVATLACMNARHLSYMVSYDGRNTLRTYGQPLPDHLHLTRIEIDAGRSSQATLLGQEARTIESLYLSPALVARLRVQGTTAG